MNYFERRALIIYCDNTRSGRLVGPLRDKDNFLDFLCSRLGGEWIEDEIRALNNPTSFEVKQKVNTFLAGADYTFIIFTGHGFIDTHDHWQYIELADQSVPASVLRTTAKRQT